MNRIIFISDFYYPEFVGGAELNDYSLIKRLEDSGQTQERIFYSFKFQQSRQRFYGYSTRGV